jgi:integrase
LAGRRQVEIPPVLQGHIHRLVSGRKATEPIFGDHWRDWPRKQVQRICKLARVPTVCAHSMRGLHSTLAIQAGASSHLVAASLGHETPDITRRSYVRPGTLEAQHATQAQARLADVIPMHGNFRVRNRSPTVPQPFHGPPTEITNQDSPPGFVWS